MATLESMVVEETREQEKPIDREKSKADTKKRRRHHDPVCIQAALDSITSKQYSERKAAFVFDIPRSTLQFNRRCQAAMFTPEEETQLAKWVITSVNNGSCRTYNDICLQAKAILELRKVSSKRSNISTPTPSLSWLSEFLVRHPRLTDICLSEPSSSSNCLPAPLLQPKVEQASPSPTADILPSSPQPEAEQDPPPPTTIDILPSSPQPEVEQAPPPTTTIDILPSSPQPEVEQAPPPTTTIDILPSSSQPEAEQAPTPSDFLPSPTADILLSLQQPKAEQAIPPPPTAHQTVQVLPHKNITDLKKGGRRVRHIPERYQPANYAVQSKKISRRKRVPDNLHTSLSGEADAKERRVYHNPVNNQAVCDVVRSKKSSCKRDISHTTLSDKAVAKKGRIYHDPEKIQAALEAIRSKKYSERKAASVFGIARATLQNKRTGRQPIDGRSRLVLMPEEETKLVDWLITSANQGCCKTRDDIRLQVEEIWKLRKASISQKKRYSFRRYWLKGFFARHPQLTNILALSSKPSPPPLLLSDLLLTSPTADSPPAPPSPAVVLPLLPTTDSPQSPPPQPIADSPSPTAYSPLRVDTPPPPSPSPMTTSLQPQTPATAYCPLLLMVDSPPPPSPMTESPPLPTRTVVLSPPPPPSPVSAQPNSSTHGQCTRLNTRQLEALKDFGLLLYDEIGRNTFLKFFTSLELGEERPGDGVFQQFRNSADSLLTACDVQENIPQSRTTMFDTDKAQQGAARLPFVADGNECSKVLTMKVEDMKDDLYQY